MRFATALDFNSGEQFFSYLKDSFDVLWWEGERGQPKMMSIGLHCRTDSAQHWHAKHPAPLKNPPDRRGKHSVAPDDAA